jgi:hypothetical protein
MQSARVDDPMWPITDNQKQRAELRKKMQLPF